MTEKMGGAEGTKLDVDFVDMERVSKFDLSNPKRLIKVPPGLELFFLLILEMNCKFVVR